QPATGSVTNNDDGTFTFSPDGAFEDLPVDQENQVNFTYEAQDRHGAKSAAQTVTVTVTGVNDAPTANAVALTVSEDGPPEDGNFSGDDVDSDDGGTSLTFNLRAQPTKGTVVNNDDGTFTFSPNGEFEDLDVGQSEPVTFTYEAEDRHGAKSAAQTVTVTVQGAFDANPNIPDAVDDPALAAIEDAPASLDVLANDTDLNDLVPDAITIASLNTDALTGAAVIAADGKSVDYDPSGAFESLALGETATDTFSYTIDDSAGNNDGSDTATATVTITGQNDTPTTAAVSLTANEDGPDVSASFSGDDIDSDDDGTSLTFNLLSQPTKGTVVNNDDGTFTFSPNGDFEDLDVGQTEDVTFIYEAEDRHGAKSTAQTVTVTVQGASETPPSPIMVEAETMTLQGFYLIEDLPGLASNDAGIRLTFKNQNPAVVDGSSGTATYIFDGVAGNYSTEIQVFDENDGTSTITMFLNGVEVEEVVLNSLVGPGYAAPTNHVLRTLQTIVPLEPGDEITFESVVNGGEYARFDFATFRPAPGGNLPVGEITDETPASNRVFLNAEAGTETRLKAVAVDPTFGDSVSYAIDDARFDILPDGTVVVAEGAVLDIVEEISVTVTATSTDTSVSTETFTINVVDPADSPFPLSWQRLDNGINIGRGTFPALDEADIQHLADIGVEHVRLNMNPDRMNSFGPNMDLATDQEAQLYFEFMDMVIDAGLAVVITPIGEAHRPVYVNAPFDTPSINQYNAGWEIFAQYIYQNYLPEDVFLETQNEPFMDVTSQWRDIEEVFVETIREHAPGFTIISHSNGFHNNQWNNITSLVALEPYEYDNIIYNLHYYHPMTFTHQAAPWDAFFRNILDRDYPGELGYDIDRIRSEMQVLKDYADEHEIFITVNEFGAIEFADVEDREAYYRDVRTVVEEMEFGWSIFEHTRAFNVTQEDPDGVSRVYDWAQDALGWGEQSGSAPQLLSSPGGQPGVSSSPANQPALLGGPIGAPATFDFSPSTLFAVPEAFGGTTSGDQERARALDALNVRYGDPIALSVEETISLHEPGLSLI
ncbi:MAG: Ig-like domain-containing protein, partial [Pseudomonadota bacterium]